MAQPQAVAMVPHNYNGVLVGLAATVHVCAVIPNFRIAEYFVNFSDACGAVATAQIEVKDGWVSCLPHRGWGWKLTSTGSARTHSRRSRTSH